MKPVTLASPSPLLGAALSPALSAIPLAMPPSLPLRDSHLLCRLSPGPGQQGSGLELGTGVCWEWLWQAPLRCPKALSSTPYAPLGCHPLEGAGALRALLPAPASRK